MKVVVGRPPNFSAILKAFPAASSDGVIFAWDDRIYSPSGITVPAYLMAHEREHGAQQRAVGGPAHWWQRYIEDQDFRYAQELAAHARELEHQVDGARNRNTIAVIAHRTAARLVAPLYAYEPPRTLQFALADLRAAARLAA